MGMADVLMYEAKPASWWNEASAERVRFTTEAVQAAHARCFGIANTQYRKCHNLTHMGYFGREFSGRKGSDTTNGEMKNMEIRRLYYSTQRLSGSKGDSQMLLKSSIKNNLANCRDDLFKSLIAGDIRG